MQFEAVMFDLDGTLADTLADIHLSANAVLEQLGLPTIDRQHCKSLIGHGARRLLEQAMGPAHAHLADQAVERLEAYYAEHGQRHTQPYPGIPQLLDELVKRNMKLAVLSNKLDSAVQHTMTQKFSRWHFDAVAGAREGVPLKPDPTAALQLAQQLHVLPERWLYVGDSGVDMLTAGRAGMYGVGVAWGFRPVEELHENAARVVIAHPSELLNVM